MSGPGLPKQGSDTSEQPKFQVAEHFPPNLQLIALLEFKLIGRIAQWIGSDRQYLACEVLGRDDLQNKSAHLPR
jgi:hypothetical protein